MYKFETEFNSLEKIVYIYTDGAAKGNPGNGGFGTVLEFGKHRKELAQGYRLTTNNRMELLAVIVGLETLKQAPLNVLVTSDSKYVVDAVQKGWLFNWKRKQFKNVKNPDLWKRFLAIYNQHKVKFKWVKGHAGHPQNERCDALAVAAAESNNLFVDEWYEQNKK